MTDRDGPKTAENPSVRSVRCQKITGSNADSTQRVSQSLAELPDAPATPFQREIRRAVGERHSEPRNKGYTLKTIARHLQDRGFDINYNTLRDALPRQKNRGR